MRPAPSHPHKSTIVRSYLVVPLARALSAVAPRLAAAAAERLFTTPVRTPTPARELQWAEDARRVTVESPEGPLAAWVWGEGPRTVLLVHGWSGRGLQLGAFAAPLVAAGFRVVAFDAPAHGASPGRRSSLFRHARAVASVARRLGPIHGVVAHSLGTSAVLLAAARHGLRPGRLVAIAPPPSTRAMTDWFAQLTGFTESVVERMRRRLETGLGFSWEEIEPDLLAAETAIEALVIHDRDDLEVPLANGSALARSFPRGDLWVTRGLGHRRILRDARVTAWSAWFLARGGASHPRMGRVEAGAVVAPAA